VRISRQASSASVLENTSRTQIFVLIEDTALSYCCIRRPIPKLAGSIRLMSIQ
jgi:hypothetical protein